jgi:Ca-activated chloride channel family protein
MECWNRTIIRRTRRITCFFTHPPIHSATTPPILQFSITPLLLASLFSGLWFTPDQQGQHEFDRGEFIAAAETFQDPMWQGAAWYRAGEFERAARAFAQSDTAQGYYNQGNAWLMRGSYETAINNYDRALRLQPDWQEARENRELAIARAAALEQKGGDMGDQLIGADDVVFDKDAKNSGQDTETTAEQPMSDQAIQAMWLRRVQTKPADFLKAKFAYQQAMEEEGLE